MRRFICIVSAFTLLLAGCVKNEPLTSGRQEPKAEIAFESPIVAPKTKSVQEIASGFPTTLDMKVWGFFSETEYPAVDAVNQTVGSHRYMPGARYEYEGAVWGCKERGYYWPHSGYLHFVAHAPAVPAGSLTSSNVTDEGLQLKGYTITDEADEDLMVSQVLYSQGRPKSDDYAAPLVFDHALSSILFRVKSGVYGDRTSPDRVDTDLRVVKIEVIDARATGDFSQQMTSWNNEQMSSPAAAQNPEKGWTVADDAPVKSFVAYDGTAIVDTRAVETGTDARGKLLTGDYDFVHDLDQAQTGYSLTNLILLPQVIKDNVLLRVTYDMTHSDLADINGEENLWIRNQVVEIPMNQCGITEWLRGYRYVYNLTLSRGKIECSIDTVPWDEYETLEYLDSLINDLNEKLFE